MKKTHIAGIIIIMIAIGVIVGTMYDSSAYVGFADALKNQDKEYYVVGYLNKEKNLEYNPEKDPDHFGFFMVDKEGKEMQVAFSGAKPQDFEKSEQIVVIGKINSVNTEVFSASKLLMKCPSKYVEEADGEFKEFEATTIN